MTKVVIAEYDAEHNTLHLAEPLEGVRDHEKVTLQVLANEGKERAPDSLRGILSGEAGEEMAALINEMFPPWND